jgi:hypothetical protein
VIAAGAMCKCGVGMVVTVDGWAHCPHCDRDCPAARHRAKCVRCERLDRSQ